MALRGALVGREKFIDLLIVECDLAADPEGDEQHRPARAGRARPVETLKQFNVALPRGPGRDRRHHRAPPGYTVAAPPSAKSTRMPTTRRLVEIEQMLTRANEACAGRPDAAEDLYKTIIARRPTPRTYRKLARSFTGGQPPRMAIETLKRV